MKLLIKNCNLISMDENKKKYQENVDILVQDELIQKIGKNIEEQGAKIIDATGKVVMPGLINTHAHMAMSIFRETLDGYNLQDWLNKKIWPMEDKLTKEDIYYASMLSCIEMIQTGTTTINDMYFMTESTIKAIQETKVRAQLTRTLMDISGNGEKRLQELQELIEKFESKYDNITFNVGIHGLYTNTRDNIKKSIQFAKKYNLPVHMHFCENTRRSARYFKNASR